MPTLQERFADLAEDAPASPTPTGIWTDGRRRARTRRVGTAAIVAVTVVALGALGGVASHQASTPPVAGQPGATAALPTQIHHPSPWLSGTGGQPPGRLSMLIPGKRGGVWSYHWGMVGVSATTGAYRYLDIPGCVQAGALSSDGRHVVCLMGGDSGDHDVVEGLGVYDTVSGDVARWTPPSGKLRVNTIAWNGDHAISMSAGRTSYVWRYGHGDPVPVDTRLGLTAGPGSGLGPDLYFAGRRAYLSLEPGPKHRAVHIRLARSTPITGHAPPASLSPSGRQIAVVERSDTGGDLLVGDVAPSGQRTTVARVPAPVQWPMLVGWADERHLMVINQVEPTGVSGLGRDDSRDALERVDVVTGETVRVSNLMNEQHSGGVRLAASLLAVPPRDFPAPPSPLNRRVEFWGGVGVLVLGLCSLVLWRRRIRA
jgi:hypothetical protein